MNTQQLALADADTLDNEELEAAESLLDAMYEEEADDWLTVTGDESDLFDFS